MAKDCSVAAGVVRWAVNTTLWTPADEQFTASLALLPPSEWSSVLRFASQDDRKRALVSRLMQRKLLHDILGLEYESICIERTSEGKPYLEKPVESVRFPDLSFNVSHHGDYVVIVSDAVSPVGVDIVTRDEQHFDSHPKKLFELHATSFTPFEWKTIRSGGPDSRGVLDQFHRHWCMKEAYIKAVGTGLGFALHRAEFHYHEDLILGDLAYVYVDGVYAPEWQFFLHKLDGSHWVCVAKGPPAAVRTSSVSPVIDAGKPYPKIAPRDTSFTTLRVEDVLHQIRNSCTHLV